MFDIHLRCGLFQHAFNKTFEGRLSQLGLKGEGLEDRRTDIYQLSFVIQSDFYIYIFRKCIYNYCFYKTIQTPGRCPG